MRICEMCGADISNRSGRARFCVECAAKRKEAMKKPPGNCEICGKPLDSSRRKYCPECKAQVRKAYTPVEPKERRCQLCGEVIVGRRYNAKYCERCAKLATAGIDRARKKLGDERRKAAKNEPEYGDTKQCKTCRYWNSQYCWCDFMSIKGRARRCEPSPNCAEYEKAK